MTGVVCRLMKPRTRCDRQGTPLSPLDAPGTRWGKALAMLGARSWDLSDLFYARTGRPAHRSPRGLLCIDFVGLAAGCRRDAALAPAATPCLGKWSEVLASHTDAPPVRSAAQYQRKQQQQAGGSSSIGRCVTIICVRRGFARLLVEMGIGIVLLLCIDIAAEHSMVYLWPSMMRHWMIRPNMFLAGK